MTEILEFILDGGSKIAMRSDEITCVCERKSKSKSPSKANIRFSWDGDGWDVQDSYDDVVKRWQAAFNIIDIDMDAVNDATG